MSQKIITLCLPLSCEEYNNNGDDFVKTLVVYDSYTGTTEKCAKMLAELLQNADLVNLSNQKVSKLEDYDCVVIGSYIHAGKISKKVKRFCQENLEKLKGKKIGIYLCMLREQDGLEEYIPSNFDQQLLSYVKVKDFFGGELNYDKMNFVFRFILKQIEKKAKPKLGLRIERINAFAQKLMDQL